MTTLGESRWPLPEGEMAERMRRHEWSATPLGPSENWPQPLRTAVDIMLGAAMPIGIYWGSDLVLLYNDAWSKLIGEKHPAALGLPAREVFPEIWEEIERSFGRVLAGKGSFHVEDQILPLRRRGQLEDAWFSYSFDPIPRENGAVGGIFNIATETTERVRAEQHKDMLMAELDHRVKNILAVVQSIAQQTLDRGVPETERLVDRIHALAESHRLLASGGWEGVRFADLVNIAVAPYRGRRAGRVILDGPELKVKPKAAQTLALALHELAANAAMHGALSGQEGNVRADWELSGEDTDLRLTFVWQEFGGPPVEVLSSRKRFGTRLIERTLAFELDGDVRLDFAREGLRAVIDLPLAEVLGEDANGGVSFLCGGPPSADDGRTLEDKRVLVVEDDYLVALETAEALRSAGCRVIGPMPSLSRALRVAEAEDLDIAVLDINLGGKSVWPVATKLRARGIPFVFATGYAGTVKPPPDFAQAPRIEKPFRPKRLVGLLKSIVGTDTAS